MGKNWLILTTAKHKSQTITVYNHWSLLYQIVFISLSYLTPDRMAAILSDDIFICISWMKSFVFWFKVHWILFLWIQLTKSQHSFRYWLGAEQATSHYLDRCLTSSLTHICGTRGDELYHTDAHHYCNYIVLSGVEMIICNNGTL